MKKKYLLTLLVTTVILFSCSKETVCDVGYINTFKAELTTWINLNNDCRPICYDGYGRMYSGEGQNLPMTAEERVGFADMGEVESLCDMKNVPSISNFRTAISLKKHHGIIVLTITEDGHRIYHRFFIEDLIKMESKGIGDEVIVPTKAVIKMQSGWKYE